MGQILSRISIPQYSLQEEVFNAISHGIGAAMSIPALVLLLVKAQGPFAKACVMAFGVSMILLYTISCIYHALPRDAPGKRVLRVIDHCNVYLLVFGTYVPASLLGVGGTLGWILFGIVAFFTVVGIVFSAIDVDRYSIIQVVCHLICGWSFVVGLPQLAANDGIASAVLIVAGGVAYTVGSILYGLGKKRPYMHGVFHVFCLIGTALHFWAVYAYML